MYMLQNMQGHGQGKVAPASHPAQAEVVAAAAEGRTCSSAALLAGFCALWRAAAAAAAASATVPDSLAELGAPPSEAEVQAMLGRDGGYRALKRGWLEPAEYAAAREFLLTRTELRDWALAKGS